jgi:hypothetical protein
MQRISIYLPQRGRIWRLWVFAERALMLGRAVAGDGQQPPWRVLASWMVKNGVRDATH